MLRRYLVHDRLVVRFGALFVVVMVLFFCAWTLSYFLLPEGLLRGRTAGHALGGAGLAGGSAWLEWLRIFGINLGVMLLCIVAPNLLRTNAGYPLGYLTLVLLMIVCGIVLGTDSFTISMGGKPPPTLMVFDHPGFYELTSFILASAATASISRRRLVGKWPRQKLEAVAPPKTMVVIRERRIGLALAIALLLTAGGWEAHRIAQAVGP